ncbi:HAMP domain-containing sensor histidine kinase [Parvularcula sp. LCG005]|uniref:sensor histidine kinase n=1 Tax=Parvularcula sp. LCG005 TaxID=3078805 RepID=UPI002943CA39|nr:HAMP domain-containing sensor histidine kinase [Parvularcula sp. LCG005]WOI53589.1 HAMP domain-containing sensor histidine kinase [Parvularcula sp. LCG005]
MAYDDYSLERNIETDRLLIFSGAAIHMIYSFLDYYTLGSIAPLTITLRLISALFNILLCAISYTPTGRRHMMTLGVLGVIGVTLSVAWMIYEIGTVSPPYYVGFLHVAVVFAAIGRLHFHVCSALLAFIYLSFYIATYQFADTIDLFAGHFFLVGTFVSCALANYHLEQNRRIEYIQYRDKETYYTQLRAMADGAQEDLKRKNALLNVLGHVVKTPLHQIIGYAQIIEQSRDLPDGAADVTGFAAEIHRAGTVLSHQSQRILDYTRAEGGLLPSQPQKTSAHRLVREAVYRHEQTAREKQTVIRIDCSETPISVDPRHVIRGLDELIDNAVRYSPPGSCISITSQDHAQYVVLSIQDDGPGIAESEINRVRDALNRTENFRNMGGDKLGIGVSLARSLMQVGGAKMTFASIPDVGSLAQIILPRTEEKAAPATQSRRRRVA